jgi:hypothetical protein
MHTLIHPFDSWKAGLTISTNLSTRSRCKSPLSSGILLLGCLFDRGSGVMGFILDDAGLHFGIHAANESLTRC